MPGGFWNLFKDHLVKMDFEHRDELSAYNISIGENERTSLLKYISYNGAIECPLNVPEHHLTWSFWDNSRHSGDVGVKRNYLDPLDHRYAAVFRRIWPQPQVLSDLSNFETIGDVVEAFFGYHWTLKYERNDERPALIEDMVTMLTMAVFSYWALDTYFPDWNNSM